MSDIVKQTGNRNVKYSVDLPFPVSVNQLYRVVRGRPVISNAYRSWILAADALAFTQHLGAVKPLRRFSAIIYLRAEDRKRRDLDNFSKCVLDWAQRVDLVTNDRGCDELLMRWSERFAPEGCRLTLTGDV